jgi:hypothetical protein
MGNQIISLQRALPAAELEKTELYRQYNSIHAFAAKYPTATARKCYIDHLRNVTEQLDEVEEELKETLLPLFLNPLPPPKPER